MFIWSGNFIYQTLGTLHGLWGFNWGLEVPKPTNIKTVFEEFGPNGDGEAFYISLYDKRGLEKAKEFELWEDVNEESYDLLTKRVTEFKHNILQIHMWSKQEEIYLKPFKGLPYSIRPRFFILQ
jgi:hypothetical protein